MGKHESDVVPSLPPRWNMGFRSGYTHPHRRYCLQLHPEGHLTTNPLLVEKVLDVLLSWNAWQMLRILRSGAELYQTHMMKQYMKSLNKWWRKQNSTSQAAEVEARRTTAEQEA